MPTGSWRAIFAGGAGIRHQSAEGGDGLGARHMRRGNRPARRGSRGVDRRDRGNEANTFLLGWSARCPATGRSLNRYVDCNPAASIQLVLDLSAMNLFGTQGFAALHYVKRELRRYERHLTKLKVKLRAGEEVGTRGVRRSAGRCEGSGEVDRGIC